MITLAIAVVNTLFVPEYISLSDEGGGLNYILNEIRIPETLTALLCGSALAVSGFILQQLFRNQLAGPYILGVSSGASLAVALVVLGTSAFPALSGGWGISLAGFSGAFAVLFLILVVARKYGHGPIILLFGVIIGQLSGALQGLLSYIANPGDLKHFTLWSMGSFSQVLGVDLLVFALICPLSLILAYSLMKPLNIMVLGDDVAGTLGVDTRKTSFRLLAVTGLLTGLSTAYCGPIAFIGMAIPNLSKLLFRTSDYRFLLFVNIILGSLMAVISEMVSSMNIGGMNIPVNVTTSVIGGPFVLYILLKNNK